MEALGKARRGPATPSPPRPALCTSACPSIDASPPQRVRTRPGSSRPTPRSASRTCLTPSGTPAGKRTVRRQLEETHSPLWLTTGDEVERELGGVFPARARRPPASGRRFGDAFRPCRLGKESANALSRSCTRRRPRHRLVRQRVSPAVSRNVRMRAALRSGQPLVQGAIQPSRPPPRTRGRPSRATLSAASDGLSAMTASSMCARCSRKKLAGRSTPAERRLALECSLPQPCRAGGPRTAGCRRCGRARARQPRSARCRARFHHLFHGVHAQPPSAISSAVPRNKLMHQQRTPSSRPRRPAAHVASSRSERARCASGRRSAEGAPSVPADPRHSAPTAGDECLQRLVHLPHHPFTGRAAYPALDGLQVSKSMSHGAGPAKTARAQPASRRARRRRPLGGPAERIEHRRYAPAPRAQRIALRDQRSSLATRLEERAPVLLHRAPTRLPPSIVQVPTIRSSRFSTAPPARCPLSRAPRGTPPSRTSSRLTLA